ncbi:MAG: DUF6273 domain-containing protein [Oscillospiraceae bacterium]|nr:DUF6273 domain-containing protein [Oscillospiraceae bacterium]
MIRRFAAIILVLALALSFAACNRIDDTVKDALSGEGGTALSDTPNETSNTTPDVDPVDTDKDIIPSIQWLLDGTYSFDFTRIIEASGLWVDNNGSLAADGGNVAISGKTQVEGIVTDVRVIYKDGKSYSVDDEHKIVMESSDGSDLMAYIITDYSGMVKTGEGTGEFNGITLPYEEYSGGYAGITARFYLDNGVVCGIENDGNELLLSVRNITNNIPAGTFDWPADYAMVDDFDYWELYGPGGNTSCAVGDVIQFGGYDWRVLDVRDGKVLLLSDKVLELKQLHHERNAVITWANSDIRQYLNGEFYNSIPTSESAKIAEITIVNNDNPWYGTSGGSDTSDKIFLLSLDEVVGYFGDSGKLTPSRPAGTTGISDEYNSARAAADIGGDARPWWLRSPAQVQSNGWTTFTYVERTGVINVSGIGNSINSLGGVRPALWLNLEDY